MNKANKLISTLRKLVLTYLAIFLVVDGLSGPILDDQLGQLDGEERYFW